MARDVIRLSPPLHSPAAQEYVNATGQRLAIALGDTGAPAAASAFTFSLINGDLCRETHEPGALPGGYVFVPAALFAQARDEAEFAGMLAHAMAHVALRHGTRTTYQESAKLGYGSIQLIFLGGRGGSCAEDVIPRGIKAQLLRNEPEADALGVQAMARAGFDPASLVNYLTRLRKLDGRKERMQAINETRARLPATRYAVSSDEFAAIREQVMEERKPAVLTGFPPTLRRQQ